QRVYVRTSSASNSSLVKKKKKYFFKGNERIQANKVTSLALVDHLLGAELIASNFLIPFSKRLSFLFYYF
uniref:hypothetical protein n=1 Tax=Algoriphagus sp. TaxID=1872435 RepID=UPI0040477500